MDEAPPRLHNRLAIWCCNHWTATLKFLITLGLTGVLIWQIIVLVNHKRSHSECKENYVVAKHGRADFRTISAAVEAIPKNSPYKFCILIRRGKYYENVYLGPEKTNIILIGDGIGKTTITSNRTLDEALDRLQLATLWIKGKGFMARDLTIENIAGPDKVHGLALESWADQSIFYRCSFVGYHATINAFEGRQFYHSCQIQGSQYFIFGHARAIFQQCKINAIKLHPEEKVVISGHSQISSTLRTGFVFHRCEFYTVGGTVANTYLGSPVKGYSMVVVMQSFLDASIVGWLVNNSTPLSMYFGEFNNRGFGANIRTSSPCIDLIDDWSKASKFTVRVFLEGKSWLPSDVPYDPDLVYLCFVTRVFHFNP